MKLIIHAPTAAALTRAKRNLQNLVKADRSVEIELVINGEAVATEMTNPDDEFRDYLVVCENSLAAAKLDAPANVKKTPAAILHILKRQSEGWAYFRA